MVLSNKRKAVDSMDAREKLVKLLEKGIEDMNKDGYAFLDLADNVKIFVNKNYGSVQFDLGNGIRIERTIVSKDE
jgi:hypothetical protein